MPSKRSTTPAVRQLNVELSILRDAKQQTKASLQEATDTPHQPFPDSQDDTIDMYFSPEPANPIKPPRRRTTRPLAAHLLYHCSNQFEEELFSPGLALLSSALSAGESTDTPACVPPPNHLAFIATIAVHPMLTTRTRNKDDHLGADRALKYLQQLVDVVEVKESRLREALRFETTSNGNTTERSRRARVRQSDTLGVNEDEDGKSAPIRSSYAEKKSLWTHAEDFWAVVGWAFNCSVRSKPRWQRWAPWLDFILDVLQNDLERTHASGDNLEETLIAQYICQRSGGRADKRRVMRAIAADGSSKEFGEIWKHETKPIKEKDNDRRPSKRRKLDLENGDYGDYFEDSHDESQDSRKQRSRSATAFSTRSRCNGRTSHTDSGSEEEDDDIHAPTEESTSTAIDSFGGMESIRLRQRFLAILTRFSRILTKRGLADSLFMNTEDFFDLVTEFLRPFPLPIFQQFVQPSQPYLTVDLQASFNENLCCPLLGSNRIVEQMNQEHFEIHFAPKCAVNSTAVDNAKLSLLLESLLRALWRTNWLTGDLTNLRKQVDKGIEARNNKVSVAGKKKPGGKAGIEEEARTTLRSSGERMRMVLDVLDDFAS